MSKNTNTPSMISIAYIILQTVMVTLKLTGDFRGNWIQALSPTIIYFGACIISVIILTIWFGGNAGDALDRTTEHLLKETEEDGEEELE